MPQTFTEADFAAPATGLRFSEADFTPDPARAAKGRALRGELVAERRSGQGADALMAGANALDSAVDIVSKMNPLTVMPRAAFAVSEMVSPSGREFVDRVPIEKWDRETAAAVLRTVGGPGNTDISRADTLAGVANAASDFAEFFTTPEGIATMGAGMAPAAARAALAAGFAGQMSSHVPEAFTQAGELSVEGGSEAIRSGLGAMGTAAFAGAIPIGAMRHASAPRVLPPAERAGKMLEAAVNDPALLDLFEQVANDLAIERSSPELAQRAAGSGQRAAPEIFTAQDFKLRTESSKVELPAEQLKETAPSVNSPTIRGEAAMETRPSAGWTPDGRREPAVSPELAETIQALREGYVPAVEKAVESPELRVERVAKPAEAEPAGRVPNDADITFSAAEENRLAQEHVSGQVSSFGEAAFRVKRAKRAFREAGKWNELDAQGRANWQRARAELNAAASALAAARSEVSPTPNSQLPTPLSPSEISEFNALEQQRRDGALDAPGAARYRELEVRAGQGDFLAPQPKPVEQSAPEAPKPKSAAAQADAVERGYYKEPSGKTVIVMPKAEYDALPEATRSKIVRYFNWSPRRKAFISKASKDDYWARQISREVKLEEMDAREAPEPVAKPEAVAQAEQSSHAADKAFQWTVPATDKQGLERDREEIAATEVEFQKLQAEWQHLHALNAELGKRVIKSHGKRWERGNIKASAKKSDVEAYHAQKDAMAKLDRAMNDLRGRVFGAAQRVRVAGFREMAANGSEPLVRRLGAAVATYLESGDDTNAQANISQLEQASRSEVRQRVPDVTERELQKMASALADDMSRVRGTVDEAFKNNPNLDVQKLRRAELLAALKEITTGVLTGDLPDELRLTLAERVPGWEQVRYGGTAPAGKFPLRAEDVTALADEVNRAVKSNQAAAAAARAEGEAKAAAAKAAEEAEAATVRQMMADAADEMAKSGTKRSATEIKKELVARLEAAVKEAPEPGDTTAKRRVLIGVPGDGVFALVNTKAVLQEVLTRAKAMSTSTGIADTGKARGTPVPGVNKKPLTPAEVVKQLEEFTHPDEARHTLQQVYSEPGRALVSDGRTMIEVKGAFPAKNDADSPFPVALADGIAAKALAGAEKPAKVSTEDLFRIGRLRMGLEWGDHEAYVDMFEGKDGQIYAEAKDNEQNIAGYGRPTTDRYLGRYNAEGLEKLARLARKMGDESVTLTPSVWMEKAKPSEVKDGKSVEPPKDIKMAAGILQGTGWRAVTMRFTIEATVPPPDATKVGETKPGTPDINTGALGESGMGGAKPGEFRGTQQTPTGIKNATVDAERAKRGLPPAMEAARRDWGSVWDEAMARIDNDPATVDRLISELKEKPRALTDTEDALLLHRQIDLQNEYGRATRELAVAYEDSKAFPNRLADVEALKVRTAELSDQLLDLYNVNKSAGTETGRGLAARKMMANEDFSLAQMEMEKRTALGGAPLTEAERAAMVNLQERIVDLERRAVEREEQVATERATRMTDEAIADMKRELASRPSYDPRIIKIAEEIVGKLEKQADKSRAFLKGKFLSPTPEDIYHLGVIGAAKIARLGLDFSKFSIEMAAEFGDGVKPYLQAAWDRANLHLENEGAKYGDKAEPVKRLLRKRDAEGQREGVIEGLKKGVEEGLPVGLLGEYVRKLALSFVRGGITERNALVDAVHKVLTEDIGMELIRRETMDAISGYGRFKPLDSDTAKAKLRDLKGQMQQVAKLEDITVKKPLQKTGVERRTQSDEERRLIQQVNEAKRRFGVVVTDPARQLKSALDAVRTRLKHQVADLEYQIATKERIVKHKTDAPFDAETKLLETRRDALRAQLDELVPRPGRTDAQLLELAMRNVERSIADYEARIAGGDVLAKRAKPVITSPELAALKARRDAVRAEWQELRELDGEFQRQRAEQALTRQKAALEESIAAKEKQLAEGPRRPEGREVARPADPALEELMQKRDALNRQLAEARKKPWEVKHAEQVARKLAAMEKTIAEREAKLAAGDLSTESRSRVARPLADPELEIARQKLDDVNRRLAEARKPKGTPEERALKALHTRLATSAAEYADRLARGDFSTRVRKPIPTDPTTLRLKAEAERAKAAWHEGLERDRFHRLSWTKRGIEHAKEVLNVPRAVLASWDVSAVLRQGGFITLAHPLRAAASLVPMFRALASETRAHMVEQEIRSRPNAPLYARAKLFLAPLETSRLTAMEEIFMSRLSRVLPGVRASERAYITFLNKLRADSFDAMVDRFERKGPPLTDAELQAVGNFINVSTGRGNLGSHAAAAETLATVFFSPRLVASRFQLLTGQPLRKAGSARVARAVAAEYAGFLGGLAVVYALANMAGASVEVDPRSSDFGKLRFGNTRVDPLAGLAQVTVLMSRLGAGEKKTISGKLIPIRGEVPYGADTSADVVARFLRSKLSPVAGASLDVASGQNVIGEPTTPGATMQRLAVPLSFEDIYKVMLQDGIPKGAALGILSLFGWGLQQHDEPKPKSAK